MHALCWSCKYFCKNGSLTQIFQICTNERIFVFGVCFIGKSGFNFVLSSSKENEKIPVIFHKFSILFTSICNFQFRIDYIQILICKLAWCSLPHTNKHILESCPSLIYVCLKTIDKDFALDFLIMFSLFYT